MHRLQIVLGIGLALLGCGGHATPASDSRPPPPPPVDAAPPVQAGPLDQDLDRLAARSLALYEDIGRAFTTAGEDCAAATAKLTDLQGRYADVIAANAKVMQEGREMQLKLALRRFDDKFQAAAKAVIQSKTMAACFQNEAFAKAFDALAGKP